MERQQRGTLKQREWDTVFMHQALQLAQQAVEKGDEPFGAVLVKQNEIVLTGKNQIHTQNDPTHHAEIGLIREFCLINCITDLSEYTLYTSCEPCCMCAGAMVWAKLGRMVYSLSHDELARVAGVNIMIGSADIFSNSPHKPKVTKGILEKEALSIYMSYFQK